MNGIVRALSVTVLFLVITLRGGEELAPLAYQEVDIMTHSTDELLIDAAERVHQVMPARVFGQGRPIVLVGGGLTGWASWQPHAERLAGDRSVALLQPLIVQYGLDNRPLPDAYAVTMESAAMARALDDLRWQEPIDIVGWSYGALISLDFALNHPERIRTLTLIEPPATWVLPDRAENDPDVRLLRSFDMPDVGEKELTEFLHAAGLIPPGAVPHEMPQWDVWMTHRRSLRNLRAPFDHQDDPARLAAFAKPVLLVTGEGTSDFLRRAHDALSAALPRARSIEMAGGHAPHIVSMDEFMNEFRTFLTIESAADAVDAPPSKVETSVRPDDGSVRYVTSKDGTRIGYVTRGGGPPLLLVHGTTADHRSWAKLTPNLEKDVTVVAMDRRGRGHSGDGPEYDFDREVDDVLAVIESFDEPVVLFGHSFGGLIALEAALSTDRLAALVIYEPPMPSEGVTVDSGLLGRISDLVENGALEAAMDVMLREVALLPDDEMNWYRSTPLWKSRIPIASTIPREMKVERARLFDGSRFAGIDVPTFLLSGEASPNTYRDGIRTLSSALPNAEAIVLRGQQHIAHHTHPELLADVLLRIMRKARL